MTPNDPYIGRTAQLTSTRCILYTGCAEIKKKIRRQRIKKQETRLTLHEHDDYDDDDDDRVYPVLCCSIHAVGLF